MKRLVFALPLLVLALVATPAQAHFLWLMTEADSTGKQVPHLCFGEGTEPGEAELLDKVAHAKVWLQLPGQDAKQLELTKRSKDEVGSWFADVDAKGGALTAKCEYGVISRGGKTFLLNYYAKRLDAQPATLKAFARAETLPLDVVPAVDGDKVELTVLWQGKPAAESEVVIASPAGGEEKVKTDATGKVTFTTTKPGVYGIRAKWVNAAAGEKADQKYDSESHYCTLALAIPAK